VAAPALSPAKPRPLDLSACKRDLDDLLRQAAAQKQVRDEKHQWAVAQGTRIRDRLRPVMQSVHLALKEAGFQMQQLQIVSYEQLHVEERTPVVNGREEGSLCL
jgi:hypothetical protein